MTLPHAGVSYISVVQTKYPPLTTESCFIVHIWSNHDAFSHLLSEFLSHGGINHFANQKHKWHWGISPLGTKKQHMAWTALRSFISKVYNLYVNQYYWTHLHFSFILGPFSELISLQIMDNKSISLSLYIWFSTWVQLSKASDSAECFVARWIMAAFLMIGGEHRPVHAWWIYVNIRTTTKLPPL